MIIFRVSLLVDDLCGVKRKDVKIFVKILTENQPENDNWYSIFLNLSLLKIILEIKTPRYIPGIINNRIKSLFYTAHKLQNKNI